MHYQETTVWQKAVDLSCSVMEVIRDLPPEERYGLRSQMSRCSVSIPSNLAEGWTRNSAKEKGWFFSVSHGSLAELSTQMVICERSGFLRSDRLAEARQLMDEVSRMLTTLRRQLRSDSPFGP